MSKRQLPSPHPRSAADRLLREFAAKVVALQQTVNAPVAIPLEERVQARLEEMERRKQEGMASALAWHPDDPEQAEKARHVAEMLHDRATAHYQHYTLADWKREFAWEDSPAHLAELKAYSPREELMRRLNEIKWRRQQHGERGTPLQEGAGPSQHGVRGNEYARSRKASSPPEEEQPSTAPTEDGDAASPLSEPPTPTTPQGQARGSNGGGHSNDDMVPLTEDEIAERFQFAFEHEEHDPGEVVMRDPFGGRDYSSSELGRVWKKHTQWSPWYASRTAQHPEPDEQEDEQEEDESPAIVQQRPPHPLDALLERVGNDDDDDYSDDDD